MQLHAVVFAGQFTTRHERMAEVLTLSVVENSPSTPLTLHVISQPDDELRTLSYRGCRQQWIDNARKAKHHNRIIQEAKDGELLCMMDTDTMVLGDLSEVYGLMDVWFDFAYTARPSGSLWRLNTGVYFVRVSAITKTWCNEWYRNVLHLLGNEAEHLFWKKAKRYGGIHQAALGMMLESELSISKLPLPCATWNAVNETWKTSTDPKIVHINAQLREWCFGKGKCQDANTKRFVDKWQSYRQRAKEMAA